ncbi:MAG: hypothetical protein V3S08_00675 [Phycisphaerales bacterium]
MKRLLMLLVALLTVGLFLPGCEEDGSSAAAEFGAQEGQRPKTKEKRPPPGPEQGGFQEGDDDGEVAPPDDD